jgi:hypothetical protein
MATWVNGEVPPAAKLQALDDRVTDLEGVYDVVAGSFGPTPFTTNGRFTFTNPLGRTPRSVHIQTICSTGTTGNAYHITVLTANAASIVLYATTNSGAQASGLTGTGFYYTIIG